MVTARRKSHNHRVKKKSSERKAKAAAALLTSQMSIVDILSICPGAEEVLFAYGISCAGCSLGGMESLEEGCRLHGLQSEEIAELLQTLNAMLMEKPHLPQTLTITSAAAKGIRKIAKEEGKGKQSLVVTADGKGGFCMEFQDDLPIGHKEFSHSDEPDVRVFASALTLRRIGGATIDFREGRFKLDLPEERCEDCENEKCECGEKDVH